MGYKNMQIVETNTYGKEVMEKEFSNGKVKKMKNKFLLTMTIVASMFSQTLLTQAAEESTESVDVVGFNIAPKIPSNQIDKNNSYFDLKVKPGAKQEISIYVNNTSGEDASYTVAVNQAYTNENGQVDYSDNGVELDATAPLKINDIATYDEHVEVPAQAAKEVKIKLDIPKEEFNGEVLAGIQVTKDLEESNASINNQYSYILGLRLNENDKKVKREVKLDSVEAGKAFGDTAIKANLVNVTNEGIGHMKYNVKITDRETGELVKENKFEEMSMAPNSKYAFAVNLEGKKIQPGNYNMELSIEDAKDNKWEFNEDFEITKKEAKEVNKLVFEGNKKDNTMLYIAIAAAALIALIIIVVLAKKNKKEEK